MKIVGVIRGGTGDMYDLSLREGGEIIAFLAESLADKYRPVDILVDRSGIWHYAGVPTTPANLMHQVDLVWNTAHPAYEWMLKDLAVPVVSQPAHFHTLGQSADMLRAHMKKIGVHLPRRFMVHAYQADIDGSVHKYAFRKAKETFEKFGGPWLVQSFPENPNIATRVVKTFEELVRAFEEKALEGSGAMVEELVSEKSVEVHTLADFRGEDVYVFPPTGNMTGEEKEKVTSLARKLHDHLEAKNYMHALLSLHPKRGVFLYGARLLPSLHPLASLHRAADSIGTKTHHIIEHLLERAR